MKYFSLFSFVIALALFGFICAPRAHAQFNSPLPTSINVDIEPSTPKPYDTVTVTLSSYDTDLDGATITWSVNGKKQGSGVGQKVLSFSVGAANTTTALAITIVTSQGETINKSYSIRPTSVDLIWEATGYTPPFYKGKTLFSHQDVIEFIALPHITNSNGVEIPPQNLVYTWTRNGTVVGDFSGYGKYTYSVQSSIVSRPLDIQVEVTSPNTDAVGSAEVVATPVDPTVLMYEKNPLYGIQFQKALADGTTLTGSKEINVIGEPYFFGTTDAHDASLSYNWNINGSTIDSDTTVTTRTFREPDNSNGGTSNISLTVNNSNQILQSATYGFNLTFSKTSTSTTTTF
jgi:hypothetical protein